MLARVDEHLVDAGLAERADNGRGLHEVRPGAKHMRNQNLHRCPHQSPTRGTNLTHHSGDGRPVRAYRPSPEPRARLALLGCTGFNYGWNVNRWSFCTASQSVLYSALRFHRYN